MNKTGSPRPVTLFHFKDAPNPRRVRGFMAEKSISLPLVAIDIGKGEHRTPEFRKMNSLEQVPVLALDDGSFITESIAICRYLEELHPQTPLFGATAAERARVEMWSRRVEIEAFQTIGNVASHTDPLFKERVVQIPQFAQTQRDAAPKKWKWLDQELSDGRPFLAGENFTVADLTGMAASWLGEMLDIKIPPSLHHVRRWDDSMRKRVSWTA